MTYYYLQTNIICIIVLLIVAYALNQTNILPTRRVAFLRIVYICIALCVSDFFSWYFDGKLITNSHVILHISNMIYYICVTWVSYSWLIYVHLRTKSLESVAKRRYLDAIPFFAMILIVLINPWTKLLFSVNEAGVYSRESGVIIHWIISWSYLFLAAANIVIALLRSKSKMEQKQILPLLWFIIPPAIAAVLQMFFYGLTSTQCGMTISILIISFTFFAEETSHDTLTGLNNRRTLEHHVYEQLQKSSLNLTVLMCDIDSFKNINDTMGHAVGDLVLKRISDSLKTVCSNFQRDVFLCRYGGDEFVICCNNYSEEDITALIIDLQKAAEKSSLESKESLCLSISIGRATGICESYKDIEGLLSLADNAIYDEKFGKKQVS